MEYERANLLTRSAPVSRRNITPDKSAFHLLSPNFPERKITLAAAHLPGPRRGAKASPTAVSGH
jgi:hypothetical protein